MSERYRVLTVVLDGDYPLVGKIHHCRLCHDKGGSPVAAEVDLDVLYALTGEDLGRRVLNTHEHELKRGEDGALAAVPVREETHWRTTIEACVAELRAAKYGSASAQDSLAEGVRAAVAQFALPGNPAVWLTPDGPAGPDAHCHFVYVVTSDDYEFNKILGVAGDLRMAMMQVAADSGGVVNWDSAQVAGNCIRLGNWLIEQHEVWFANE